MMWKWLPRRYKWTSCKLASLPILVIILAMLITSACEQNPNLWLKAGDGGQATTDGFSKDDLFNFSTDGIRKDLTNPRSDISFDACRAIPEACNNVDDNCDTQIDEGFDKLNDPLYCENCKGCAWLLAKNAYPGCNEGKCAIKNCIMGYYNADGDIENGCEYPCIPTGVEICDGIDNDCNKKIDDGVTLPANQTICKTIGACQGAQADCKGADGWQCVYGPEVELHPCSQDEDCGPGNTCDKAKGVCPGIVAIDEKKCDGKDGDCDGVPDDPWANPVLPNAIGKECDVDNPPKKGICRNIGKYACDVSGVGVACLLATPGQTPKTAEVCNGLDDDCDGLIDEATDDAAGKRVIDEMVHIKRTVNGKNYDFYIYSYEAVRPDANDKAVGSMTHRSCSRSNALPWAQVNYAGAKAACEAAGKKLCTGEQWLIACQGATPHLYPYGDTFNPTACNGYENGKETTVPSGTMKQCVGGDTGLFDMSGNLREWTDDQRGKTAENVPIYVVRGGAYHTPVEGLTCNFELSQAVADVVLPAIGFRCCSSNPP